MKEIELKFLFVLVSLSGLLVTIFSADMCSSFSIFFVFISAYQSLLVPSLICSGFFSEFL